MIKCENELRQIAFSGEVLVTEYWLEVKEVLWLKALHNGGYSDMKLLMVSMHEEDGDGNSVHDVYESNVEYYLHDDKNITIQDLVYRAVDSEKHIKEYRQEKSVINYIEKQRSLGRYQAIVISN